MSKKAPQQLAISNTNSKKAENDHEPGNLKVKTALKAGLVYYLHSE